MVGTRWARFQANVRDVQDTHDNRVVDVHASDNQSGFSGTGGVSEAASVRSGTGRDKLTTVSTLSSADRHCTDIVHDDRHHGTLAETDLPDCGAHICSQSLVIPSLRLCHHPADPSFRCGVPRASSWACAARSTVERVQTPGHRRSRSGLWCHGQWSEPFREEPRPIDVIVGCRVSGHFSLGCSKDVYLQRTNLSRFSPIVTAKAPVADRGSIDKGGSAQASMHRNILRSHARHCWSWITSGG